MHTQLLYATIVLLILSWHQYGQGRQIAVSDIEERLKKAAEERKVMSYRVKVSATDYARVDAKPEVQTSSITKFSPPNRSHTVAEQKTPTGLIRTETIRIGSVTYVRRNDGAWSIPANRGSGVGSGSGNGSGSPSTTKPTIKEEAERLGDNVYQTVRTVRFDGPGVKFTRVVTKRYSFDAQGRLVKEVFEDKISGPRVYRQMTEYEYDSSIKIDAPIP